MSQLQDLQALLKSLRFSETANNLPTHIKEAEENVLTYTSFLMNCARYEQKLREEKLLEKRFKWATFPYRKTLNEFDIKEQQSLSKKQFHMLGER